MTVALLLAVDAWAADAPSPERQRELTRLVRQECGFCHGLRLTGGLGSPLTAAAMRERPAETMVAVILHGIPGTAMPGWQPFLTEADAGWIVTKLQEGFPE
jgi:cytochrome c55X